MSHHTSLSRAPAREAISSPPSARARPRVRRLTRAVCLIAAFSALAVLPGPAPTPTASAATDSVVVRWNTAALAAVRASTLAPPVVARALAMIHTCVYDAWAAYDQRAMGTRLAGSLRLDFGRLTPSRAALSPVTCMFLR